MIVVGQRVESLNFGWVEVTKGCRSDKLRGRRIKIRFDNTLREKEVLASAFLTGNVADLHNLQVGEVFKSTYDGNFEILKITTTRDVSIKFQDTGNILHKAQKDAALCGYVRDRVKHEAEFANARAEKEAISTAYKVKQAEWDAARLERKAKVDKRKSELARKKGEREAAKATWSANKEVCQKQLRDNALSALASVGCDGDKEENPNDLNIDFKDRDGNWVLRFSMNKKFIQTRLGRLHNNMTQRAGKDEGYADVTVSEDFKVAQKFCDWVVQQKGWGEGFTLEKDLMIPGNRQYSADACVFVPHKINSAIITNGEKTVATKTPNGWRVQFFTNKLKIFLGVYPTKDEALDAYRKYRVEYVRQLAKCYQNKISVVAFDALMKWHPRTP